MITLSTDGFDDLTEYLDDMSEREIDGIRPGIVDIMRKDVEFRFLTSPSVETGGEVHGNVTWKPLAESTLKARPDRKGGKLLIDSGALRDSLTIPESSNSYTNPLPNGVEWGTTISYSGYVNKERTILIMHPLLLIALVNFIQAYYRGEEPRSDEYNSY